MQQPRILLADEPTASLDPKTSVQILELIEGLSNELELPVLMNIHNVAQAKRQAQRIVGLRFGQIIFDGSADELDDEVLDRVYEGTAGTGDEDDWVPAASQPRLVASGEADSG